MNITPFANSIFEQPFWLDIVAPDNWGEVFVKDGEKVIARMPYVFENKRIFMPKLTQTLGPWIAPEFREFKSGNIQLSKQKEIISELLSQLPEHKSFNMCFDSANEYILPYRWLGYSYKPSFSYRINDLSDLDVVYANFNKTAKKNIKAALNKTVINDSVDVEVLWDLLNKTFEAQNRKNPMNKEIVKNIVNITQKSGNGKYFEAKDSSGNVHSCAYFVYDEKVCYYLLGATDSKYRNSGAQSLVIWEGIKFASERSKAFDFEGSNIEGIENFFRQFGGERVINYDVIKFTLFDELLNILKPRIKRFIGYKI